jgi:hypothetical protein
MKLNGFSQLGLRFTEQMKAQIYSTHSADVEKRPVEFLETKFKEESLKAVSDLLDDKGNQYYLMASTAMELAQSIKIGEEKFDVCFLNEVPDKKITFLLGKNLFFRYMKRNGNIYVIKVKTEMSPLGEYLRYVLFRFNTETGYVSAYDNNPNPFEEKDFLLFIQLMCFTELSELEIKLIKPNQAFGTKRQGKYKNESRKDIILVDSTWNKIIVRTEGFKVSGHCRLQRFGKGRKQAEIIYIAPFMKKGYIRRAKSGKMGNFEEIHENADTQ